MGLRDEIQAEMAAAFDDPDGLADAVKPVTGQRQGQGGYDPVTGTVTPSLVTYAGRGVFGSYSNQEIDGSAIFSTDEKLLCLQSELFITVDGVPTDALAQPAVGDMIGGKRALNVEQDPAGATWTIQLRA